MNARLRLLLVLGVAILGVGCGYSRGLDSREIESLLTDASVEGVHHKDGYAFSRIYRADGTMVQTRHGATAQETATWDARSGNKVCVTWDADGRELCRVVRTDDQGAYWKVLRKKNGDTMRIVTYSAIVDAETGQGRMRVLGPWTYRRVWLTQAPGLATIFATFLGSAFGLALLARGRDEPESLYNRLRRLRRLQVGDTRVRFGDLERMSPGALQAWIQASGEAEEWIYVAWGCLALHRVCDSDEAAWERLWTAVSGLDDAALETCLRRVVQVLPPASIMAPRVRDNDRASWLLGRAWLAVAVAANKKDPKVFERAKAEATVYVQGLRDKAADGPEPISDARRESPAAGDYLALAAQTLEGLLYLKYVAASSKRGGSGSMGGG